ncbi:hypothetical protein GCM10011578_025910 [Streptomyces fuscichromogenes]|uniref:Uncharacterized protein n=1 Tax=Streptomyces fuscichromogenes TaxID=1324013 RepID=A0A918CQ56_9ACTN|nr:hypothetical protein GCM10011578_025910 [Streptomyces fuscichromogenes]
MFCGCGGGVKRGQGSLPEREGVSDSNRQPPLPIRPRGKLPSPEGTGDSRLPTADSHGAHQSLFDEELDMNFRTM